MYCEQKNKDSEKQCKENCYDQQHVVPKKILLLYLHFLFFKTNISNIRYYIVHITIYSLPVSLTMEKFLAQ
jgi:hypothetical protein